MIIALSMNPCVDRALSVDEFRYGGMNRVQRARDDVGGKAVNLSIVAASLGERARCMGLLPKDGGGWVKAVLRGSGVEADFIEVPGRVRVNIKLMDEAKRVVTELNERGEPASMEQLDALYARVLDAVRPGAYLVLTGSLPPGCPNTYYERLVLGAKRRCRCVLDADGEALSNGLRAGPFMIKPNRDELEQLLHTRLKSLDQVKDAALEIARSGVALVAVTLGGEGALITDGERVLYAPALRLDVRSTVGAGDSLVAGVLVGLSRGETLERAFQMGVAAASASVLSEGTQLVEPHQYEKMLSRITIQRL